MVNLLSLEGLFLLAESVAFLLPVLVSRKWLGPYAVLSSVGFLALWLHCLTAGGEGSIGDAIGSVLFMFVVFASIWGFAARLICTWLRDRGHPFWRAFLPVPIMVGVLVAFPVGIDALHGL